MIDENFLLKIEQEIGFRPLFHDDYIPTIVLDSDNLVIKFQFLKENAKYFKKIDIDEDKFVSVKFHKITNLMIETDGFCNDVASLMFDFFVEMKDGKYHVEVDPSCGVYFEFIAESYEIIK
jgi:hypothetical protein